MYEVVYSRADLQHGPPSVASHSVGWITSWNAPTISRVVHTPEHPRRAGADTAQRRGDGCGIGGGAEGRKAKRTVTKVGEYVLDERVVASEALPRRAVCKEGVGVEHDVRVGREHDEEAGEREEDGHVAVAVANLLGAPRGGHLQVLPADVGRVGRRAEAQIRVELTQRPRPERGLSEASDDFARVVDRGERDERERQQLPRLVGQRHETYRQRPNAQLQILERLLVVRDHLRRVARSAVPAQRQPGVATAAMRVDESPRLCPHSRDRASGGQCTERHLRRRLRDGSLR